MNAPFTQYARKSVVALLIGMATAVASALGILLAAVQMDSDAGTSVSNAEWIKFAIALLVQLAGAAAAAYGVYQATNAPQPARYLNDKDVKR